MGRATPTPPLPPCTKEMRSTVETLGLQGWTHTQTQTHTDTQTHKHTDTHTHTHTHTSSLEHTLDLGRFGGP